VRAGQHSSPTKTVQAKTSTLPGVAANSLHTIACFVTKKKASQPHGLDRGPLSGLRKMAAASASQGQI